MHCSKQSKQLEFRLSELHNEIWVSELLLVYPPKFNLFLHQVLFYGVSLLTINLRLWFTVRRLKHFLIAAYFLITVETNGAITSLQMTLKFWHKYIVTQSEKFYKKIWIN